jgi:hypothetical protein
MTDERARHDHVVDTLLANVTPTDGVARPPRNPAPLAILAGMAVLLAVALLLGLAACGATPTDRATAPTTTTATLQRDGTGMSDAQLADALNAACAAHPGACTGPKVTATNLPVFLAFTCRAVAQTAAPDGNAAWRAAWHQIAPLVVSSGRCG